MVVPSCQANNPARQQDFGIGSGSCCGASQAPRDAPNTNIDVKKCCAGCGGAESATRNKRLSDERQITDRRLTAVHLNVVLHLPCPFGRQSLVDRSEHDFTRLPIHRPAVTNSPARYDAAYGAKRDLALDRIALQCQIDQPVRGQRAVFVQQVPMTGLGDNSAHSHVGLLGASHARMKMYPQPPSPVSCRFSRKLTHNRVTS